MTSNRRGVIAISRKLFDPDDPFFGGEPFTRREAWQWLIAEAAYKARKVNVGNGRGVAVVALKRGQTAHSKEFMRQAWGWSSEKTVRTFLDRLEVDGRISRQKGEPSGQPSSIITVCKYDEYQFSAGGKGGPKGSSGADHHEKTDLPSGGRKGEPSADVTASNDATNQFSAGGKGGPKGERTGEPTEKKGRELEEGKANKRKNELPRAGEPAGFAQWYATYPKRKAPKDAMRAYAKLITSGEISEADLLTKTETFAATWRGKDQQFCPYPASWLNAGSYSDEPDGSGGPGQPSAATPAPDPATFTADQWQRRVTLYDRGGEWGAHWGPRPGEPGCMVPSELLKPSATNEPPVFSEAP